MKQKGFCPITSLNGFWLINFPVFSILLLSYLAYSSMPLTKAYTVYFVLLAITQAGIGSWLLLGILPYVLYRLSLQRLSPMVLSVIIASVLLFYLLLDSFVYYQYNMHLNWALLQMIFSSTRNQVFNLFGNEYLTLCIAFGFILLLEWSFYRILPFLNQSSKWIAFGLQGLLVALLLVLQGCYVWADAFYNPNILMVSELLPLFHGATAKRFLTAHHLIDSSQQRPGIGQIYPKAIAYPLRKLRMDATTSQSNILILAIDAWRQDSLNAHITPNIARFSESASSYMNHFSGGNCTRAGLFSLFYSINPALFDTFYKMSTGPVLFNTLPKKGYAIGAYTSASAVSPPFHRTIFTDVAGFEPTLPGQDSVERDQEVTRQIIQFVRHAKQNKQPFFAFAFYDSAHAYQYPPPPFKAPFQPAKRLSILTVDSEYSLQLVRNQYNNALYFIDTEMAKVLSELEKQGVLEETLVIITADHGEEFNDNGLGFWGHNGNFTAAQTKVPMVIHWPGQRTKKTLYHTTSHYDVVPTLMKQILGVKNALSDYSLGFLINDTTKRDLILMGSYNNTAMFSAAKQRISIVNRLGFFETQDLHGKASMDSKPDKAMLALAFDQMQRFLRQPSTDA